MRFRVTQTASLAYLLIVFLCLWSFEFTQAEEKRKILFLGDSITAGYGLERSEAYPAIIKKLAAEKEIQWEVLNAGLSGDTTSGGVRRVKVLSKRPFDVMVIALGGNDGLRGIQPAVTEKNLLTIIETAQQAQPDVSILLVGIEVPDNMGGDYKEKFLKTFQNVAEKTKVNFLPNLIKGVAGDSSLNQDDVIHPNAEGQKIIAAMLFEKIKVMFSEQ